MVTPPVYSDGTFIAQFPAFACLTQAQRELAWQMGANWMTQTPARWGLGAYNATKLQQAADLMGAVVCSQFYGGDAVQGAGTGRAQPNEAPGAIASATQGSVTAQFQLPEIGTSAFSSMLLASPPYGRLLLALLQISASVGPYIPQLPPCIAGAALMPGLFNNKLPAADVVLEFNAASWLPAGVTLTGTPQVAVSVSSFGPPAAGTDPDPTAVLNGAATLDTTNMIVLQPVKGGVAGVSYLFDVQCNTSSSAWAFETQGILPVGY